MLALRAENRRLRDELAGGFRGLIGSAPAMRELYRALGLHRQSLQKLLRRLGLTAD